MEDEKTMIASPTTFPRILSMRERCELHNRILRRRLDALLPAVMRECGFDMWLVICNEDNWDPVLPTLLPMDTWTPILQMFVFYDRGEGGVERISISRTNTFDYYDKPYTVHYPWQQWPWLREVIEARDPKRIAINQGETIWAADGLSATHKEKLLATLPRKYAARLASGEDLCRRWMETLIPEEMELYPHVVSVAHALLREIFSRRVITPGVTTLADLRWAYWQMCNDRGLEVSFCPFFYLARRESEKKSHPEGDATIRRGDVVYCDVGIKYLGLITDTKECAYVLREGEHDAPEGLRRLLAETNRLQDIYCRQFVAGRTGNEMLRSGLEAARAAGVNNPRIYSHSCGHLLHEPGPLIGHPLNQENWPGRGDVPLNYDTSFVCEISADGVVPEWDGQSLRLPTEEQILFTREGTSFIDGRQTEFYLI